MTTKGTEIKFWKWYLVTNILRRKRWFYVYPTITRLKGKSVFAFSVARFASGASCIVSKYFAHSLVLCCLVSTLVILFTPANWYRLNQLVHEHTKQWLISNIAKVLVIGPTKSIPSTVLQVHGTWKAWSIPLCISSLSTHVLEMLWVPPFPSPKIPELFEAHPCSKYIGTLNTLNISFSKYCLVSVPRYFNYFKYLLF